MCDVVGYVFCDGVFGGDLDADGACFDLGEG